MAKYHDREYFYKYVSAETAKKILINLQIKCTSPLIFNDPFDSQIAIQHDIQNERDLMEKATTILSDRFQLFPKGIYTEQAHRLVCDAMLKDKAFVSERNNSFKKVFNSINTVMSESINASRVFCVSEKKDDLLMWAHYADEHKGAVIRFKCLPEKDTGLCAAKQVHYSEHMPIVTIKDLIDGVFGDKWTLAEKISDKILLTKGVAWEYEREWRMILRRQSQQDFDLRGLLEEELEAIYLGCRMSANDRNQLLDIIKEKRRNVSAFQSEKDHGDFKLNFRRIDY